MRNLAAAAAVGLVGMFAPLMVGAQTASADEQAIRALDARWNQLIAARDLDGVVALYAADGVIMPPNAPPGQGPSLRETWKGLFATPGLKLVITPVQVEVAGSRDLAYDRGTYLMAVQGAPDDRGKYVVVWKKQAGQWKAVADIFNSDGPAR